jgi:hypothetical protein
VWSLGCAQGGGKLDLEIRQKFAILEVGKTVISQELSRTAAWAPLFTAKNAKLCLERPLVSREGIPGAIFASLSQFPGDSVMAQLKPQKAYSGCLGQVTWSGYHITDLEGFVSFLEGPVRARCEDEAFSESFAEAMRAVLTTGMEAENLEKFLNTTPPSLDWEIGEALAECFLTESPDWQAKWPSNSQRDRRTPRASLPGADLVGFKTSHGDVLLLFGEVKTSSDQNIPPGVMNGRRHGLAYQIETHASPFSAEHLSLLKWLWARCQSPENRNFFEQATRRYLASKGKEILLVGMLMRDTQPDERDVKAKGEGLGGQLTAPTLVEFLAVYSPKPIQEWRNHVSRSTP